jgi:hypothetical protein
MRKALRDAGNAVVATIPTRALRAFFKCFNTRPEVAEQAGFFVSPRTFWSPIPDPEEVDVAALSQRRILPAVDLREKACLGLLERLIQFAPEIAEMPAERVPGNDLWLSNETYTDFDAASLYAMLRLLRPRRYVEIGCGFSTTFSKCAIERNSRDGFPCESQFVEPYPSEFLLRQKLPGTLRREKVQQTPLDLFEKLGSGDVLFIDTSHVLKTQSDVEHELLRVLPLLKPGVWVHFHDIFTPYDYPSEWVLGAPRAGNSEQYALECLLSGGTNWQVELPLFLIWKEYRNHILKLNPRGAQRPAGFWVRRSDPRKC